MHDGPTRALDARSAGGTARNVRAILIAGDQAGSPGTPTPGAERSLEILASDLRSRFCSSDVVIERLGIRPTKQLVDNAFAAMRTIARADELFIVMFAGHGKDADSSDLVESWSLTSDETFSDIDLAAHLLAFPDGIDSVVISDCCYGEGLFRVGAAAPAPDQRASPSRALGRRLGSAWARAPKDSPMVCISAASEVDQVTLTKLVDLARETVVAAGAAQSYAELSRSFAARAVTGREFHVDARPHTRIHDLVLSTTGHRSHIEMARPRRARRSLPRARRGRGRLR